MENEDERRMRLDLTGDTLYRPVHWRVDRSHLRTTIRLGRDEQTHGGEQRFPPPRTQPRERRNVSDRNYGPIIILGLFAIWDLIVAMFGEPTPLSNRLGM